MAIDAIEDAGWLRCYESNVMSHLWVMQACQEELRKNRGAMVITASVAGTKPSGSSMVCFFHTFLGARIARRCRYCADNNRHIVRDTSLATTHLRAVSKSATIHLTRSLAIACAPNVRVNCVAAGVMLTDWSKGFTAEHIKNLEGVNALRSLAQVEDVAQTYGMSSLLRASLCLALPCQCLY